MQIKLINTPTTKSLYKAVSKLLIAADTYDDAFRSVRGGTFEEIKAKAIELGVELIEVLDSQKEAQCAKIEKEFLAAQAAGTSITLGHTMRCSFDDALTVREAAAFLQRVGQPTMSLRDVDNVLHENIPVEDCLAAADEVAAAAMTLWNTREAKKKAIREAADFAAVRVINW